MESAEKKPPGIFFKELYWFVLICIAGCIVGLLVLPPRARKYWKMRELESKLTTRNLEFRAKEHSLKSRLDGLNDPFYKEALTRKVLELKKNTEEYLQP